jgi:hypothetical protein
MGVGVSIDESTQRWDEEWQEMMPYFDAVYGLFFGVIEPSQCRQQLARIRANVPRIVYVKESNRALEGCSSFFPDEVKRQILKYNQSAIDFVDIAKAIAGYDAGDEEIREVMLDLLSSAWDPKSRCWNEPNINLAAAFKARHNYSLWNLANLLREELEDEGHTVVSLRGAKNLLVEEMSDLKDEQKKREAALIADSNLMPLDEAQKLIGKLGTTKDQQRSATKTLLVDELPGVQLTPEFIYKAVTKDRRRWLSQQKLFWYCCNFEAVKKVDTDSILKHLRKFAEHRPFMPDMRTFSPKVKVILKSGIFDFINLEDIDAIYQGDSPEAETFLKRCLKNRELLKVALNIFVTKKSHPINLANRILQKMGLQLEKLVKSKSDNRYRLSADIFDPDRLAVLDALDLKWHMSQQQPQAQTTEETTQQSKQHPTEPTQETQHVEEEITPTPVAAVDVQPDEDIDFCLRTLNELEANPQQIRSEDELVEVFRQVEATADRCSERLPQGFWERLAAALGTCSDLLAERQSRLDVAVKLLKEAIVHGAETVYCVLKRWTLEQRWEAILRLEKVSCEEMDRLVHIAPDWGVAMLP